MLTILLLLLPQLPAQVIELRPVERLLQPLVIDSNSPSFWRDGELVTYSSLGSPSFSTGLDQGDLGPAVDVSVPNRTHFPMWIESVWRDSNGVLYAWYHHEPSGVCSGSQLTAPEIGALISLDNGRSFSDLGIVLKSGDAPDCGARNGYFASGHGDFSVIPDRDSQYFYFVFGSYGGPESSQGIAIARMAFADRNKPVGKVMKYYEGEWDEPGIEGKVTPVFPVMRGWAEEDTDAFWGPSVHWNTYLGKYVAVMNRSCCAPGWPQEGIYLSVNSDISDPSGWTTPLKLLGDEWNWYPRMVGTAPGETDSEAGRVVRLYVRETSDYEVIFHRREEWLWEGAEGEELPDEPILVGPAPEHPAEPTEEEADPDPEN